MKSIFPEEPLACRDHPRLPLDAGALLRGLGMFLYVAKGGVGSGL